MNYDEVQSSYLAFLVHNTNSFLIDFWIVIFFSK